MMMNEDSQEYSNSNEVGCEHRYSFSSSEGDFPTTALLLPVIMEAPGAKRANNGNEQERQPPPAPTSSPVSVSAVEPEIGNVCIKQCSRSRRSSLEGIRSSCQSLVGSAQIKLQLFVEEVKVELKELTRQNGDRKNSDARQETENKDVGVGGTDDDTKKVKVERTGWRRYIGIMLAIASSMMFALCILIVKLLPKYYPSNVGLWRFQGLLWPALSIAIYCRGVKKEKIFDIIFPLTEPGRLNMLFFLFLRGVAGATAVILHFYALQYISMADSTVIAFSTPVFVSLASHFLLGEKSGFVPVICGVITLGGVVIITRPPILTGGEEFDQKTLIGSGISLACMVFSASTFLLLRYLRQMHFSVITGYFGIWGSIQSLILSTTMSKIELPEGYNDWIMAVALAVCTFIGQFFITLSLKYEQAGTISLCRTCDILFSYIWQFVFLGEVPDKYSMIGGGIVIFGIVVAAFRKYLSDLPEGNQTRKRHLKVNKVEVPKLLVILS